MALGLLLLALTLLTLTALTALAGAVRHDGYGRRPAPRSHEGWGTSLPSVPPASLYR